MSEEPSDQGDLESLRSTWKTIYSNTLPSMARTKDVAQPRWPVTLDHCFARIILDNTIGHSKSDVSGDSAELVPWDTVIDRPAVRTMSAEQLRAAIRLGRKIQQGEVDLVELDRQSLLGRGKSDHKYGSSGAAKQSGIGKRKGEEATRSPRAKKQKTLDFKGGKENSKAQSKNATATQKLETDLDVKSMPSPDEIRATLKRIDTDKSLTEFRRRLYTSLLSVPRGEYTNYATLAKHLDSVARAVGNGMMNNPFAPDVPCHRVLASDGSIGGFGGDWARDGKMTEKQQKKMKLLQEEGIKFDSAGKVKGLPWDGFWDRADFVKEYGEVT